MALEIKRYADSLNDMAAWLLANQDVITDFNEGSVIRSMLETLALELEQAYLLARVGFNKELINVPQYAFDFQRQAGNYAAGNVVFSRTGTTGTVDIPAGTIVSTTSGAKFTTTAAGQITNGNTQSGSISVLANEVGTSYNVPAAAISIIVTPVTGVETVTNSTSTTGGLNAETDDEYRIRFQQFIEGLGQSNVSGLVAAAKSVTVVGVGSVRSASVVEYFPPTGPNYYNLSVYVDDGAGNAPAGLLTEVAKVLNGDPNDIVNYPGVKAAGVKLEVLAPSKVSIDIVVQITDDDTASQDSITANLTTALTDYVNNLLLGEDVIYQKIVEKIMLTAGVMDIYYTGGQYSLTVNTTRTNVTIGGAQIARIGTITITYTP